MFDTKREMERNSEYVSCFTFQIPVGKLNIVPSEASMIKKALISQTEMFILSW